MAISPIETEKEAEGILTLRKLIQFFGMYGVFSLMHAKIFNYPSYIIKNENFIYTEDLINLIGNKWKISNILLYFCCTIYLYCCI